MEVNFDGIVGPTHHYGGLSFGNVASSQHRSQISHPKEAALQGLQKMKALSELGIMQAVLPPQERPLIAALRQLGFTGQEKNLLAQVARDAPELLHHSASASSMWAANAATVTSSADAADKRVHFTPANLISNFHRSLETTTTATILKAIFANEEHFVHHAPLPCTLLFSDEGAANQARLCRAHDQPGIQLFVYGRQGNGAQPTKIFPPRQTLEASQAIARNHVLNPAQIIYAQQNPVAIDAGVFHNDVISIGNCNFFLTHEEAFINTSQTIDALKKAYLATCGEELITLRIKNEQLSLKEAISSYLFNSQLITLSDGTMLLAAPSECQEIPAAANVIQELLADLNNPIKKALYFNLRQSMQNGGGPACLRLRVVLNAKELAAIPCTVMMNDSLYTLLTAWVNKHYRDTLCSDDLADPQLLEETRAALDELTQLLGLGTLYPFQQ